MATESGALSGHGPCRTSRFARDPAAAVGVGGGGPGFTLVEILVVLSIVGLMMVAAIPRVRRISSGLRVRMAAQELAGELLTARSLAVRHGVYVGLKITTDDPRGIRYRLYRDGDGDGVRTADIATGVDPAVGPAHDLAHTGADVDFGFPPGPAPRDPGDPRRRLDRLDDPVRFNRSDIASFSPLGESTPGSLYLSDGAHHLAVVRLFGRTGKVKVMMYEPSSETWR